MKWLNILAAALMVWSVGTTGAATGGATVAKSVRQGMADRVSDTLQKQDGLGADSLQVLCQHYVFTYSEGMCKNAKAGVPVGQLVNVAAHHYPELGELLSKRRNEAALLEKLCGRNGHKLRSKLAAYEAKENKLNERSEDPDRNKGKQQSGHNRQQTAMARAAKSLTTIERSLNTVEELDGKILRAVDKIQKGAKRTDVSIVKAKSGYRLSANISTTISPDSIIREQQYVWERGADNEDEGVDL